MPVLESVKNCSEQKSRNQSKNPNGIQSQISVPQKKTKKQIREDAIVQWWNREPWPAVILAVDPGRHAGASIIISRPYSGLELIYCKSIDVYSREVDYVFAKGFYEANRLGMYLVLVLEAWGAGGRLGIDQWVGLGEMRGIWKREFVLLCNDHASKCVTKNKTFAVSQSRWRSRVIQETGDRSSGKFKCFTTDQWKEVAQKSAQEHFPDTWVPPLDAAESACIGIYAARSDELGSLLGKRYLKIFDLEYDHSVDALEKIISGKKS